MMLVARTTHAGFFVLRKLATSTSGIVSCLAAAVLALRGLDDPWVALTLAGAFATIGVAKLLKRALNESRPRAASLTHGDPGMPSTHASALLFFATSFVLRAFLWGSRPALR